MGWTPFQTGVAVMMVITGSINTLAAKWANYLFSEDSIGAEVEFNHPYLQSCAMFVGEFLCMGAFYVHMLCCAREAKDDLLPDTEESKNNEDEKSTTGSSDEKPPEDNFVIQEKKIFTNKLGYLLLPASLCDMCGTSIMYVALTLTSAASFQMLRGSVIIFTGINSMVFLKRRLEWFRWFGMFVILAGLIIVGLPDFLYPTETTCYKNETSTTPATPYINAGNNIGNASDPPNYEFDVYRLEPMCKEGGDSGLGPEVLGDVLIICAQLIVSVQMVYEEKVLSGYHIQPLHAVGWEGFWGFLGMSICLVIFYFIDVGSSDWSYSPTPPWILEDALDGFIQLGNNPLLLVAILGTVFSIAFFNFAGLTVTKELSATTRMVLDSVRTLVIWLFSISIGWQKFQYLQLIGFAVLLVGMSLYNDLLIMPTIRDYQDRREMKKFAT